MRAIIIDDEKKSRDMLQKLAIDHCPEVTIAGVADSVENGYNLIKEHAPDLVFLDVEMPDGSGFDLLEKFKSIDFHVIFTSAHSYYGLKAIRYSAADYLLKPINPEEFIAAVHKIKWLPLLKKTTNSLEDIRSGIQNKLTLPLAHGNVYVKVEEVIRMEAAGSYTTVFMKDGEKYTVSRNLKEFEDILKDNNFFRSHNSHLINLTYVKKFIREEGFFAVMEDGSRVEIARRRKDEFLSLMEGRE